MNHLNGEQIENYTMGRDRELDTHVATCAQCQRELAVEQRLAHALTRLERFSPAPEFSTQLDRALLQAESTALRQMVQRNKPPLWAGVATLLASLLLLVFAFQTIVAFQDGGALDFVALYFSRPDLVSTYPSEAVSALLESLPLAEFTFTLGLLVVDVVLAQEFFGRGIRREQTLGESKP